MAYSVSLTKSGQMTLPKILRVKYGITDQVEVEEVNGMIVVKKPLSFSEKLRALHDSLSPETKAAFKKMSGKTLKELRDEIDSSAETKKYYKDKYGL